MTTKLTTEQRRKYRVRNRIRHNALTSGRPRLSVHRTNNGIYAQVIDDTKGVTLAAANTLEEGFTGNGGNVKAAEAIGKMIAERAVKAGVKTVVFDRGAFLYHGRIKALADAARAGGLEF